MEKQAAGRDADRARVDQASCTTCAELASAGRDPEQVRAGLASGRLYRLIEHHIEVHGTPGEWEADCTDCDRWQAGGRGIARHLAAAWSRHHAVMHALGIVNWGAGVGLRFADMPPRVPGARRRT